MRRFLDLREEHIKKLRGHERASERICVRSLGMSNIKKERDELTKTRDRRLGGGGAKKKDVGKITLEMLTVTEKILVLMLSDFLVSTLDWVASALQARIEVCA